MESDEHTDESDEPARDFPRKLFEIWGNQLERIKQRAEAETSNSEANLQTFARIRVKGSNWKNN